MAAGRFLGLAKQHKKKKRRRELQACSSMAIKLQYHRYFLVGVVHLDGLHGKRQREKYMKSQLNK
jgi:hypothetical protein